MGTNYYIKHKVPQEKLDKVKELIDKHEWTDAIYELQTVADEEETHIGKSSYGWRFCFQYHTYLGSENSITKQTMFDFINQMLEKGNELVDEYGEKVTVKELDELIESKQGCKQHEKNWHTFQSYDDYDWGRGDFS